MAKPRTRDEVKEVVRGVVREMQTDQPRFLLDVTVEALDFQAEIGMGEYEMDSLEMIDLLTALEVVCGLEPNDLPPEQDESYKNFDEIVAVLCRALRVPE